MQARDQVAKDMLAAIREALHRLELPVSGARREEYVVLMHPVNKLTLLDYAERQQVEEVDSTLGELRVFGLEVKTHAAVPENEHRLMPRETWQAVEEQWRS